MRHLTVARLALALAALLAAAAFVFAWHQADGAAPHGPGGGSAADGEGGTGSERRAARLFETHCGACHEPDRLAADLRDAPDPARAVLELLAFLEDHGGTDDRQDRSLAALLLERSRAMR